MKLEGEHRFTSSRAEVWRALQDPQILANSLPGVKRLEVDGPDRYTVTVTVGVGAVKGAYDGTFALSDKQELESCTVKADASGPPGSVGATASMRLRDGDGGGTVLSYEADAKVTGPLAGVGQRMIAAASKKTTKEFLAAIDRELTKGPSSPAPAPAQAAAPASASNGAAAEPAASAAAVFAPAPSAGGSAGGGQHDLQLFAGGALIGFLLAIVGILIGRRTA